MRRLPQREIEERVARAAEELGLTDLVDRRPGALSGGQRQRVALGRALVREPNAFLLDEPLSNLDARLRVRTRARIARLHRRLGATMVYVTHDQEEAMTLGDRIAVMDGGRIRQFAPPRTVYREPADTFVAAFVGSPEMNLLPAFRRDGALVLAGTRIELPSPPGRDGEPVTVGIRPPDVDVVPEDRADLIAVVDVVEPLGSHVLVHAGLAGGEEFRLLTGPDDAPVEGKRLGLALRRRSLHFFDATTGLRVAPASRAGA
jgi:sn-glycerol 3-phosphate transport system ATP-binding protein